VRRLAVLLGTGLGLGRLPVAPATWASAAVAILLFFALPWLTLPVYLALTVAVIAIAIPVSGEAEKTLGHDAHPIVIDEVVGMMVTMCDAPALGHFGPPHAVALAAGFLLFRVFDIWKPPPVDRAQALPGGFGVVVDDVLAGVYANLALQLLARIWR
jgi:phosphatidylglycerophosphatase A